MKKIRIAAMALAVVAFAAQAAAPSGYYRQAEGKTGKALLQALEDIVGPHTTISYGNLWDLYYYSDLDDDNKIIDMYSTVKFTPGTNQCGNYSSVGDCYNREHSFPKSWFNDASPMVSDAFHIVPTDGYVNNQRSNYPFGVCAGGTYLPATSKGKPLGKLGTSTYPGYSGKVFEPDDIYKGDFARMYFYMAAAYNNRIGNWNSDMLAGNSYPAFSTWALNMLLEWHRLDPVSDKETKRNDAVYNGNGGQYKQNNRNPFVDHPELVEYIWGNKVGTPWTEGSGTDDPVITSPTASSTVNFGIVGAGSTTSTTVYVKGFNLSEDLEIEVSGNGFTTSSQTVGYTDAIAGKDITIYYAAPSTPGTYSGTLTISSSETAAVQVPISATVVSGIPAYANNVKATSFVANWTWQHDADSYNLHLTDATGTAIGGYPVSVEAQSGQYTVTGLTPNTVYRFKLSSATVESNEVEVTTADGEHLIDIISEGGFDITATRGQSTLPVIEARLYTENITENVTITSSNERFDLSTDKATWSSSIVLDPDGEDFYIRLNDVSAEGEFHATVSAESGPYSAEVFVTATVAQGKISRGDVNGDGEIDIIDVNCIANVILGAEDGTKYEGRADVNKDGSIDIIDVNVVINIILGGEIPVDPETFTETWEGLETGGYWTNEVQGAQFKWNFKDAGIWADTQKIDGQSCRLGKTSASAIEMAEDIATGASKVSFWASYWNSTDGEIALSLEASTDSGESWSKVQDFAINSTTLTEYSAELNIAGNVRFRFVQTAGKRGNIDNIAITDNPAAKRAMVINSSRAWDAVSRKGAIIVSAERKTKVAIYNINAEEVASISVKGTQLVELPAGIYVVAAGKHSKNVIVK